MIIDKVELIMNSLDKYPASLNPDQVAEALGVSRRTVDRLLGEGRESKMEYFVIDENAKQLQKRVTKPALIAYILGQHNVIPLENTVNEVEQE